MQQLTGVRAVVTGATSGIGSAIAAALLAEGAAVAVAARPSARLTELVALHRAGGLAAEALPVDVRDPDYVEAATAAAYARLGGVDLLVNNAGIGMRTVNPRFLADPRPFFEVSPAGFADVVATNLTATSWWPAPSAAGSPPPGAAGSSTSRCSTRRCAAAGSCLTGRPGPGARR